MRKKLYCVFINILQQPTFLISSKNKKCNNRFCRSLDILNDRHQLIHYNGHKFIFTVNLFKKYIVKYILIVESKKKK